MKGKIFKFAKYLACLFVVALVLILAGCTKEPVITMTTPVPTTTKTVQPTTTNTHGTTTSSSMHTATTEIME